MINFIKIEIIFMYVLFFIIEIIKSQLCIVFDVDNKWKIICLLRFDKKKHYLTTNCLKR